MPDRPGEQPRPHAKVAISHSIVRKCRVHALYKLSCSKNWGLTLSPNRFHSSNNSNNGVTMSSPLPIPGTNHGSIDHVYPPSPFGNTCEYLYDPLSATPQTASNTHTSPPKTPHPHSPPPSPFKGRHMGFQIARGTQLRQNDAERGLNSRMGTRAWHPEGAAPRCFYLDLTPRDQIAIRAHNGLIITTTTTTRPGPVPLLTTNFTPATPILGHSVTVTAVATRNVPLPRPKPPKTNPPTT